MKAQERFMRAMAPTGNLFLLTTLPELRRQGLTYLAFYALQRAVEVANRSSTDRYTEYWLRTETGLADYETSRACTFLQRSGLVKLSRDEEDGRVRLLVPRERGRKLFGQILAKAADRLSSGIQYPGRERRFAEATNALKQANRILHGSFQLSFFDKEILEAGLKKQRSKEEDVPVSDKARSEGSKASEQPFKRKKRVSAYEQIFG